MTKHILQIVDGAYRVNLEEQDDPAIWITHAMTGAGGKFSVLLQGNAVNYAVKAQDASGLRVGDWKQTQPVRLQDEVSKLLGKGVEVFIVDEDCGERGLERGEMISGLTSVARSGLPALVARFDQVWHW